MRGERGAVLLEVIVALTILAVSGGAALMMVSESALAVERARVREAEFREASAFLDAVSLWPREDLDRRLGSRSQGIWRLEIQRTSPVLYDVSLRDVESGVQILRTAVYRPDSRSQQVPD